MKKALDYLYAMKQANEDMGSEPISIYEAIEELEELSIKDKLAELEKAILNYYLAKGYIFDLFGSRFQINISTFQNQKEIQIMLKKDFNSNYETVFRIIHNTPTDIFDEAFENFSLVN